jgi:uncharacterized protein YecT (DUF1311 family)
MRYWLALLVFLYPAVCTSAADPEFCEMLHGKENCDNANTLRSDYAALDKELNVVYRKVLASQSDEQRKYLRDSQRVWLQFRQLECDARYKMVNPGDAVLISNVWQGCINGMTKSRIEDLKRWY